MNIAKILNRVEQEVYSAFFYTPPIFPGAMSYYLRNPRYVYTAGAWDDIDTFLKITDDLTKRADLYGVVLIPYEAGYWFQPVSRELFGCKSSSPPGAACIFYDKNECRALLSSELEMPVFESSHAGNSCVSGMALDVTEEEYAENIRKIKEYIRDGHTYQINYTARASFGLEKSIAELFIDTIANQSAAYTCCIHLEDEFIVSFSPELFFSTDYNTITCRPMKGTVKRGACLQEDRNIREALLNDEKNLAENVMIVDLLRNDLGRICEPGSVRVEQLFDVESYETLFQLTSTVKGELQNKPLSSIIANLFPCGSITGAPKIRSMEIIAELEKSPRRMYTGSVGLVSCSYAVFNIAIRTLHIVKKGYQCEMGLGGGIVWDSTDENEFEELLLKGSFLTAGEKPLRLIESLRYDEDGYFLLEEHLERLEKAAAYFLFSYDRNRAQNLLEETAGQCAETEVYKVRLVMDKWGQMSAESTPIHPPGCVDVLVRKSRRSHNRKYYKHKTTFRPWDRYLDESRNKGFFEVVFCDEDERLLEGAFTNIFIVLGTQIVTPPGSMPVLEGCFRRMLIEKGAAAERKISVSDLKTADAVFLGNSVRKSVQVATVTYEGRTIWSLQRKHE